MVGIQLGLIDQETGAVIVEPQEIHTEDEYSFRQMTEIAKNYGAAMGRLLRISKLTCRELDVAIIGFVRGMDAIRPLSATEREWIKTNAFNAAQPWLWQQPS